MAHFYIKKNTNSFYNTLISFKKFFRVSYFYNPFCVNFNNFSGWTSITKAICNKTNDFSSKYRIVNKKTK